MGWYKNLRKMGKRMTAWILAITIGTGNLWSAVPAYGSNVWPQKSTAPYYCLDGGKSWRAMDQYASYQYDTLPSSLTEIQAKRLFWAYPSNWNALKEAAKQYDPELYHQIADTVSGPNVVKKVKDDPNTDFALIADHPDLEERAIAALEAYLIQPTENEKTIPDEIRESVSREQAAAITVKGYQNGPGALQTEWKLGSDFIKDIGKIEAVSVWDNGSSGSHAGWVDASQESNLVKPVMGENLYDISWGGESIKIQNNGSVLANERPLGNQMSEEKRYNKTTVLYKITMRPNSGWGAGAAWNEDYLHEWMEFQGCVNDPGHQRLYLADIRMTPSEPEFYFIVRQDSDDTFETPEYGQASVEVPFQVFRHEEIFSSTYNVKLKKLDHETGMPLKGSQFYLYERFESEDCLSDDDEDGNLNRNRLDFQPWSGYQIFSEGTTDVNGEISYTDNRRYSYSKTYCDGHAMPEWSIEESEDEDSEQEEEESGEEEDSANDRNREAAAQWLQLADACEMESTESQGTHFHWLLDPDSYEIVQEVLEQGEYGGETSGERVTKEEAFVRSGCEEDCEKTYEAFINLRFSYTWKEVQARHGYILHGIHEDDAPIEIISTNASEAGADSVRIKGNGQELEGNIWYAGDSETAGKHIQISEKPMQRLQASQKNPVATESNADTLPETGTNSNADTLPETETNSNAEIFLETGTDSNASALLETETASNASKTTNSMEEELASITDHDWDQSEEQTEFFQYIAAASPDNIKHLKTDRSDRFSFDASLQDNWEGWLVYDHRTEGQIHINKRDMDLYQGESEEYSSYGDVEGDGRLHDAVYGLFAAEDIVHPDSELLLDGTLTNTGIVYQKDDLAAVARTDQEGNASFLSYTVAPGMYYDYETEQIEVRTDHSWIGPENQYEDNQELYGNWWINRPLILGNYYVKELSRSEGYELSINGKSKEWTNYGADFQTPLEVADARGLVIVSMPELAASMEGDEGGSGFNELPFTVMSRGTSDDENNTNGYEIIASGFPKDTKFYRVDSGVRDVTGPRVVGTEEVIMKDDEGNVIWEIAESDSSHVKYVPQYSEEGAIISQIPMIKRELQTLEAEHIPGITGMNVEEWNVEIEDPFWNETLSSETPERNEEFFYFLKAEVEEVLHEHGYEVPKTVDGTRSQRNLPVYSMGVIKGQEDIWGMTTEPSQPAVKTVYGAAIQEVIMESYEENTTLYEVFDWILTWYREHPQWSFGGIHNIGIEDAICKITLYAGEATKVSRRFFTMKAVNGSLVADKIYAVYENPKTLRWEYQEYSADGEHHYEIHRQYAYGSGAERRYYLDAALTPAMMVDENGIRIPIESEQMVYHKKGEEIVDYLNGDPAYGYRVPKKLRVNKIEIATEQEMVEQDVEMEEVTYDRDTRIYRITVKSKGTDSFGDEFSDQDETLTLSFTAKLPIDKVILTEDDIRRLGDANVQRYQPGDEIGYAEYLVRWNGASIQVSTGSGEQQDDTYIVSQSLVYKGQHKIIEDGETKKVPVQILERPIKQKIKIKKEIEGELPLTNFRFKLYLKSNLERLYCDEDGTISWLNGFGEPVDVDVYQAAFPELVQNFYTKPASKAVLETVEREHGIYHYEKFFDAIRTANTDKWRNQESCVKNTSWKPWAVSRITGIENQRNTSVEAKENAKRSDAVRQFASTWYLEKHIQRLMGKIPGTEYYQASGGVEYPDEIYDQALYASILEAEEYLRVFFQYDLDSILAIPWDQEENGGIDQDFSTLSADQLSIGAEENNYAYGVSPYLPYGDYILVEQQPEKAEWNDFPNRHYKIDAPKELSLPIAFDDSGETIPSQLVPWSMTEPGLKEEWSGYAEPVIRNRAYQVNIRVEKLDTETGEPILHAGAVFALYKAKRNEEENGDGKVKRYETDTLIYGSKSFVQAMGARQITKFTRTEETDRDTGSGLMPGTLYSGWVSAGTPICKEEDRVYPGGRKTPNPMDALGLSTIKKGINGDIWQTVGFFETVQQLDAGVYVLAEHVVPAGYVRTKPVVIEVYSDSVVYDSDGKQEGSAAMRYGDWKLENGVLTDIDNEIARIFVNNTATTLEVSKEKPFDVRQSMKVSGRVEGSISALKMMYGLENLELAYNSQGTYLGYGWKKGTLEYLEQRKKAGESVELVYEKGVFQGYGYVTRTLETADDENRYVPGATLALYQALIVERTGNSEDTAYRDVEVVRDRNNHVISIAALQEGKRIPLLFYDLANLKVLETSAAGERFGYDRNGQKVKITFDTTSIFAIRNGQAVFEITGDHLEEVNYDLRQHGFVNFYDGWTLYHLDEKGCHDAKADPYTGLAYVEGNKSQEFVHEKSEVYVWPVYEWKDTNGEVVKAEKILTGRPGEKYEGTEQAYITGTVVGDQKNLRKTMNPVYDRYGLVQYYPENENTYKKGEAQYDRDGEYIGYRYEDLLKSYNQAAYGILDPEDLYHVGDPENEADDTMLKHRKGESWIIPNRWISGEATPQDPYIETMTTGQADILRRVIPGTYILEEEVAPKGYVRTMPVGVQVEEITDIQRVSMTDQQIKVEISKVDGTGSYKKNCTTNDPDADVSWVYEAKSGYSYGLIEGVKLALYKAKRVYTSDYHTYPNGYYLEKTEQTPACWYVQDSVENEPRKVEAVWISSDVPKYFEGIPAGDYILEELHTPNGYIPASMEITIKPISDLQSFVLPNDHTKLEIYKYEIGENQSKHPLKWPDVAEFSLYPTMVDSNGNVLKNQGEYLYEKTPAAVWNTGGHLKYSEEMIDRYESMFHQYGSMFETFSWKLSRGEEGGWMSAKRISNEMTANGETVTQIWELGDHTYFRVTAILNDGQAQIDQNGKREVIFEYQFNYCSPKLGNSNRGVSYDFRNGIHRIDYLEPGVYVLVETKTPEGFVPAKTILIRVDQTEDVHRYYVENERKPKEPLGTLLIEKVDSEDARWKLEGAVFEVKNLQTGEVIRVHTDETGTAVLENLQISGTYESGAEGPVIYEVQEIYAPAGYQLQSDCIRIRFREDESENQTQSITIKNEKTSIAICKQDFQSEHFVIGAKLAIYEAELADGVWKSKGEALNRWISEEQIHMVTGLLSGGKTYLLVEEEAPAGYRVASPIRFTISPDGKRITEITENMMQIWISYQEGTNIIDALSVVGRAAIGRRLSLQKEEEPLIALHTDGTPVVWKDVIEDEAILSVLDGEVLNRKEELIFSDGSSDTRERFYFRWSSDSQALTADRGTYPVGTTYVLRNDAGVVMEQWTVQDGIETHRIENEKNRDGCYRFTAGGTYRLEEYAVFQNSSRELLNTWSISLDENGNLRTVHLKNEESILRIKKTDLHTGNMLEGTTLVLKHADGEILDRWVSQKTAHVIKGKLIPGEMYRLIEESPTDGYAYANEILFRFGESDHQITIAMENRPTHVEIQKVDGDTGKPLSGAELVLQNADGVEIDRWISDSFTHVIRGKLKAGECCTLTEVYAPRGYVTADPITFVVSSDGQIDRIILENHKNREPIHDEPGENGEEEPEKVENKTYGRITAVYQITPGKEILIKRKNPVSIDRYQVPETGDPFTPWIEWLTILLAAAGGMVLLGIWRKNGKEKQKK